MADYQILIDFQDGNGLVDYTSFISGESFIREQVVGYDGNHEISTLTMTFKPIYSGSNIFYYLVNATQLIKIKVYKDTLPFFTGVIRPNGDYEIYEDLRPISVEVLDNTYLVDKKVPIQKLFPQGEISAVDRIKSLLTDIGISSSNYDVSSVSTDAKIGFLLVDEGENYKDILDNICFECGYSYYFDESGKFILKNVAPDNPYPSITIGNDKLLQPFTLSKTEQEYDGVKVIAPRISFHPNQLVFRGIKDGGSKIPVSYGLYYPENANNVDVFQKYSVVSGAKEDKFLYASANKVLDATFDEDISIEKQELSSTQAQVYFKNNSIDTTRYIQKFDIRADIYKNSGEVESVVSGTNPQEYKTKYISSLDTSTVDRLANILYDRQRNYNYVFEFSSKESVPVGSFYYVQVTDKYSLPVLPLNSIVFVFSKTVKDGDTSIHYKAVRFSEYSNNVLPAVATTRMVANSSVEGTLDTEARIADTETTVSTLSTTVNSQGVAIASQANQITALGTQLSALEGVGDGWADFSQMVSDNATAVSDLTTRVTTAEGNITTAQTTASNALSIANTNTTGLASVVTDVSTIETTLSDEVSKSTELKNRVDAIINTEFPSRDLAISNINETITTTIIPRITSTETGLSSLAGRVTTAEGTIVTHATEISQNADEISSIATRVSSAEGTITNQATLITQNANAITAVAGRTTVAEGIITTHTTQIAQNVDEISSLASRTTTIEGNISNQATLITQNANAITALATRTTAAEGTITTHTSQISQNADGLSSVITRVGVAENLITQNATSISQNADAIELKVGAVDTNGNEVIGAKLEISTIDGAGQIKLDADKILLSGSVKADKIDVDDLMAEELVIKNQIRTQNNNVVISSNGSITAINATLEGGTFTGSVEHPSFKTVIESPPSSPISLPSKTRWRADYLYNALSSVAIGNTWKSSSGSYLSKSIDAVSRIDSRQRLILASASGGDSGNAYANVLLATITVPNGANRMYFWFDVEGQNGSGYIYATKNKTATGYQDANLWSKSTSDYSYGVHDIFTTTRTDIASGDVIRIYSYRTDLFGYNFQVQSNEYDKGTFIRTSDGEMYHFLYGGYYTSPVSISSPNSYTSAINYVLASSVASMFNSYGSGGTYKASGTLNVDGTNRDVTNLMRDGSNITFYFTSGNPTVLTANDYDGATYGSYNVSGSVTVVAQEAGILVRSITPMVNATSATTIGGTDIGNGSYKIRNITGAGNITGFNSISATTITGTTIWGAVAN